MAKLKFKEDETGELTTTAIGMHAKDGEYVAFSSECDCVGPVIIKYTNLFNENTVNPCSF